MHRRTTFREEAIKNGFKLVAVKTGDKRPVANGWTAGQSVEELIPARLGEHNTGILTAGMRAVDVDVDEPEKAAACERVVKAKLGSTITRFRSNSSRVLLLYRAAEGEPKKTVVSGSAGKVEVLGAGQHFVAHGIHTSEAGNAVIFWRDDRGPHNTARADLRAVSETQITEALAELAVVLGTPAGDERASKPSPSKPPAFTLGPMPEAAQRLFYSRQLLDMNAAAKANLPRPPSFEDLETDRQNDMLEALVASGKLDPLADASRDVWLPVQFGFADAGHKGATRARDIALAWAQRSARFVSDADFERDWRSLNPDRGITVGTLIKAGRDAGFDFGPWFGTDDSATTVVAPAPSTLARTIVAPFFKPIPTHSRDLYAVPWLILGFLLRGDITLIVAPGGGAKTALAVSLAVALAAQQPTWGSFDIKPQPGSRRVAYISMEEDDNRLGLLVQAAKTALNLNPAGPAAVDANLVMHDGRESGWKVNPDRPDRLAELEQALLAGGFDLVVLDTAAGLTELKDENDNLAITRIMGVLGKVARAANCAVLMICHTPKLSKRDIVALRGDPSLVRGGGAWVNSARVAITLTGITETEALLFAINGIDPASVRCLLGAKMNDRAQSSAPVYFRIRGVMVQVRDGSCQEVRAVEFISLPAPASTFQPSAVLKVAMGAIEAGVMVSGTRHALSPRDGANTARGAQTHVANALRGHNGSLGHDQARALAKQALGTLINNGWVEQQEVPVPAQSSGKGNGMKMRQGLVCRWERSPWPDGGTVAARSAEHEQAAEAPSTQTTQNSLGGL